MRSSGQSETFYFFPTKRLGHQGNFKPFIFFPQKDSTHNKGTKSTKTQPSKSTKAQNANKRISDFFPLRCFLSAFFIFVCL